jgi:hypothetical protein
MSTVEKRDKEAARKAKQGKEGEKTAEASAKPRND